MKKTKLTRSLLAACSIVALSAVMYGCIGGGDDPATDETDMEQPTEPQPMEPEQTPAEQLANAQAAVTQAQAMVETLTSASSPSDQAAAYSSLAAAQAALAEASGIPENEIALLKAEIARLQGVIDQAAADAKIEAARIAAEEAAEAARIAALVAGTEEAETKETAIAAEAMTDGGGLGGTGTPENEDGQQDGAYNLAIKYGETSITVEGATADDDVEFMQAADLGNGRTKHVREIDADEDGDVVTEIVIVATDIAAPRAVAFAKWEGRDDDGAATTPHTITVRQDGANVDTDNPADSHEVAAGIGDVNLPLIMSATFAVPPVGSSSATHTFLPADDDADEDTTGLQPREAAMVDGTYRGADGTYTCSGTANCTVTVNDKGAVTGITGAWIFTPDMGATSDQPDYDYLHYGFWLQKTADADGVLTYNEVQTFAGSSIDPSGDVTAVTGKATYEGGATGVYVHSEVNSDGTPVATTAGQFAADVSLTATFAQTVDDVATTTVNEGDTIAPNMLNTLTGSISNFALEHGEGQQWLVALQGDIEPNAGTAAGTANGGGTAGTYTATFHGSVTAVEGVVPKPSSVVGEFDANFSNGSVAGAFGARK